jgi:hypothetical protein
MALKNTVQAVVMTSLNSNVFNGAYHLVNGAGLSAPCFLLRIINNSNTLALVSYDGVNNHDVVAAGATLQIQLDTPNQPNSMGARFPQGLKVYVNGAAAGVGFIDVAAYYQPDIS